MDTDIAEVDSPHTTEETSIENVSTDDLRNALGITEQAPQEEVAPEPEGSTEEPQPEAVSQETEVESQESEEEKLAKRRIRPRNELDQQVIDLYRSEGFSGSFADASRVIYGQDAQPAQPQISTPQEVEAAQPDPIQGIDKQADDLRASILELEGKVEQAAEDLETTEALRLQREIMKQELQLQNLANRKEQLEARAQEQVYQTHRSKAMSSRDRVYERYPELQDTNSVIRKQFDDYVTQAQSDPDYAAVFDSPKWPELVANEFASLTGLQVGAPAPVQAPAPQAPQMGTQAKVLTTGAAAQPVSAPVTAQGLVQQLPNMSNDDIYALLGAPGGATPGR